jgi:hypothetical protein
VNTENEKAVRDPIAEAIDLLEKSADPFDKACMLLRSALKTQSNTPQDGSQTDFAILRMPRGLHPDTVELLERFMEALAEKLRKAEEKYGYSNGWKQDDWMDECRAKLLEHLAKGDPRDVANYCAFLWWHGAATTPPQQQEQSGEAVEWLDEQWIDDTCNKIGDLYEKAGTPVNGLAPVAQALREAFAKGKAATASQESAPGQEAVASEIFKSYMKNCEDLRIAPDLYGAFQYAWDSAIAIHPTSTAIAVMAIKQAANLVRESLGGRAGDMLASEILALNPANAEAELEALMMKAVDYAFDAARKPGRHWEQRPAIVRRVLDEKVE